VIYGSRWTAILVGITACRSVVIDDGGTTHAATSGTSGAGADATNSAASSGAGGSNSTGSGPICAPYYADCDHDPTNGCESYLSEDPKNCGKCGHACQLHEECGGAECQNCCNQGGIWGCWDCSNVPGVCDPQDLQINCGACGKTCSNAHGQSGCDQVCACCVIASCDPGYDDCDSDSSNGCETDLMNTDAHCGDCMHPCPMGTSCVMGQCK
jgi:hypothetical protein